MNNETYTQSVFDFFVETQPEQQNAAKEIDAPVPNDYGE